MTHQDKTDALQEIVTIAKAHSLTMAEISRALQDKSKTSSGSVWSRLFGYIGGIFVFAGICIFIAMQWSDMGSAARVIITLGTGFAALLMGLAVLTDERYERAATPLLLIASGLQAVGIMVMLKEYGMGGDPRYGILFMSLLLLAQQGFLFISRQRAVMAFCAIFFGSVTFVTLGDLMGISDNLVGLTLGAALVSLSCAADKSKHRHIASFWYFIGGICLLWSAFDILKNSPMEAVFIGLTAGLIYLSATVRSRALLTVSTVGMLGYISYFTGRHFSNTLGWPITLVLAGLCLILLGALALKINNKYIRDTEG